VNKSGEPLTVIKSTDTDVNEEGKKETPNLPSVTKPFTVEVERKT